MTTKSFLPTWPADKSWLLSLTFSTCLFALGKSSSTARHWRKAWRDSSTWPISCSTIAFLNTAWNQTERYVIFLFLYPGWVLQIYHKSISRTRSGFLWQFNRANKQKAKEGWRIFCVCVCMLISLMYDNVFQKNMLSKGCYMMYFLVTKWDCPWLPSRHAVLTT